MQKLFFAIGFVFIAVGLHGQQVHLTDSTSAPEIITEQAMIPRDDLESFPGFPGGPSALDSFFRTNIIYPKKPEEKIKKDYAIIKFVVNEDGSLSDLQVIHTYEKAFVVGYAHSSYVGSIYEAIRVLRLSPNWIAGTQNGTPVKRFCVLFVSFKRIWK